MLLKRLMEALYPQRSLFYWIMSHAREGDFYNLCLGIMEEQDWGIVPFSEFVLLMLSPKGSKFETNALKKIRLFVSETLQNVKKVETTIPKGSAKKKVQESCTSAKNTANKFNRICQVIARGKFAQSSDKVLFLKMIMFIHSEYDHSRGLFDMMHRKLSTL